MQRLAHLFGPRPLVVLLTLLAAAGSAWFLELSPRDLIPSTAGLAKPWQFFSASLDPAWDYEDPPPANTPPLWLKVLRATWQTIAFAAAAVGCAFVAGIALGFFASTAFWETDPAARQKKLRRVDGVALLLLVWPVRGLCVLARSIHELLWAVLFLSAMGLNTLTAILAIAIPYTGVFAKVFSEIIDEAPRDSADAIRALGGGSGRVFLFGILPRALPDMTAYACYRLECGIRSSAVMGFFGITTIGYYLRLSFDESHYHEVWTYLWALVLIIVVADLWSSRMRKSLLA